MRVEALFLREREKNRVNHTSEDVIKSKVQAI